MQHFVVSVIVYVKQWKSENCIQIARAAKRHSQQLKFKTQKCSRINNSKNLIKKKCRSTAPENVSVCCAFISISMELHFDNKNDNDIYCLLFIRFRWMRPFHCIHVCVMCVFFFGWFRSVRSVHKHMPLSTQWLLLRSKMIQNFSRTMNGNKTKQITQGNNVNVRAKWVTINLIV